MKRQSDLGQKDFDALLAFLSPDREEAGAMYEKLHRGLVRFFKIKGCDESAELADETLSRVAARIHTFDSSISAKPTAFVYGFASNLFLEYTRHPRRGEIELDVLRHASVDFFPKEEEIESDPALDRLEQCLAEFSEEDRMLLISYYGKEGGEKVRMRKQIAAELDCSIDALHMRVHRLRRTLKICMDQGSKKKSG